MSRHHCTIGASYVKRVHCASTLQVEWSSAKCELGNELTPTQVLDTTDLGQLYYGAGTLSHNVTVLVSLQ